MKTASSPATGPSQAGRPTSGVSVLIPTKDRAADLALTIESVLGQTTPPGELLIVDQSRDDAAELRTRARWARGAPGRLVYLRRPELSGLAAARNCAMDRACGEIWLFLDDDVVLEPDFLAQLLAAYRAHPEATGISGVVTNYDRPGWADWAWTVVFARGPFHDQRQAIYWNAGRLRAEPPRRVRRLGGGLMSFRAAALRGLRFDEQLCGVCDGEDVDFCARLGSAAVLLVAPGVRLAHYRSPAGREPIHWLRRQARSETYLYLRNWRRPGWRGWAHRLCFGWLQAGFALAASLAAVRRCSASPWRAWRQGVADARRIIPRHAACAVPGPAEWDRAGH